jgi:hypothetical protein
MRYWLTYLPASRWAGDPPPMRERVGIVLAAMLGPYIPQAWYLAPQWKLDMWHRIGCDLDNCPECDAYFESLPPLEEGIPF